MQRVIFGPAEVVENPAYSRIYHTVPVKHPTRVTVVMADGERIIGESGADKGDLSNRKSDAEIEAKFRGMAEDCLGVKRTSAILEQLWHIEKLDSVAGIPPAFVLA